MKTLKYSLTLFLLLNIFSNSFSQKPNTISPKSIYWIADGKQISIEKAQKGINKPNKLSIVVVFNNSDIQKFDGQKLEFIWYKRGATRNYLLSTFLRKISKEKSKGNLYVIKAGRSNLKKGWLKVKIETYTNRELLSYKNKKEFWIKLL